MFLLCLCLPLVGAAAERLLLGIDVLEERDFDLLRGQRVGLLTHPAGVNRQGLSTIEVLRRAPEVNLVALFGPEHGIYGNEKADVPIDDRIDPRTGLPVFSLYGRYRPPTPAMLSLIAVLVVDLQDIGTRSYTYVSCMRYAMEACFEAGKTVVVLDRPNPLGGRKVDGPPLDPEWESYVGAFPVPYVHGLTIGELARLAKNQPGVLKVDNATREAGRLHVVPMRGWERSMLWTDTGLRWIPTSPAIPDLSAVIGYPLTGLGTQLGGFTHGYGTAFPFRFLRYPGKSPEEIARALNARAIPGLRFRIFAFTERGEPRRGVYVVVTDWEALRPTELSFHMMQLACEWSGSNPFAAARESLQGLFNKHVGSTAWWDALSSRGENVEVSPFVERWAREARAWQQASRQWWLYR
ncbi:MAG: DUF1343 domain-containing protein [Opitutales bacterium]